METRYAALLNETDRVTKELQHALALRELCCADFDRAQRWLRDTEVQLAPEQVLTTAGVGELERSLQEGDSVLLFIIVVVLFIYFNILVSLMKFV